MSERQRSNGNRKPASNNKKANYSARKGKGYSKRTDEKEESDSLYPKTKGSNDPAWYAANQSLLRDAASIPYSWAVGTPIDFEDPLTATLANRKMTVPGIQAIKLQPSVGQAVDANSPINLAANSTYAFVRYANSGHTNYDSPDLMLYIMAMSQVYSYIVFLQRIYGVSMLYAQKNRYLPTALLTAMGVDGAKVQEKLADLRYGINKLISQAASFAVPDTMSIFKRHAFLYGDIYTEGDSIKDQLYLYTPAAFWKFKWDEATVTGKLETVPFLSTDGASVDALIAYGTDMISRLILDEDINIMSGDILKAYGSNGLLKLAPLNTDYPIIPTYNFGVLEQMKNATIFGNTITNTDLTQSASKAYLVHEPKCTAALSVPADPWKSEAIRKGLQSYCGNRLITTSVADVTPEVTMENSRLLAGAYGYVYVAQTSASVGIYCGSEIASAVSYYYYKVSTSATGVDTLTLTEIKGSYIDMFPAMVLASLPAELNGAVMQNNFKFHPASQIQIWAQDGATNNAIFQDTVYCWDIDNYAILNNQDIRKLHEAALLNELAVPSIAKLY